MRNFPSQGEERVHWSLTSPSVPLIRKSSVSRIHVKVSSWCGYLSQQESNSIIFF